MSTGHPAPPDAEALLAGGAWYCGCTAAQMQEQSMWLHFALPVQLKSDPQLVEMAGREGLVRAV
jgi:hypothetical protein